MLDVLSQEFRRFYSTPEAATGAEAKATLDALACVLKVDVGLLECRFSFLRRICLLMSQTHTESFNDAVATFLLSVTHTLESELGQHCTFWDDAFRNPGQSSNSGGSSSGTSIAANTKKHSSGGPWRAFLSNWLLTQTGDRRLDFKAAGQAYRDVYLRGGEAWETLKNIGTSGTQAKAAGGRAFGRTDVQLSIFPEFAAHSTESNNQRSLGNGTVALAPHTSVDQSSSLCIVPQLFESQLVADLGNNLRVQRSKKRHEAHEARQARLRQLEALKTFSEDPSQTTSLFQEFQPVPSSTAGTHCHLASAPDPVPGPAPSPYPLPFPVPFPFLFHIRFLYSFPPP